MPELPEVETIRLGLQSHSAKRRVEVATADESRLFRHNTSGGRAVLDLAEGRTIGGWSRRGKFMWVSFEGADPVLVVHLGMSGQVLCNPSDKASARKHEHLRLELDNQMVLQFNDPRTFGHLTVSEMVKANGRLVPAVLAHIGPDPLENGWEESFSWKQLGASNRKVKTALLDQTIISGIGNIYADESLYRAGIRGDRTLRALTEEQWVNLVGHAAKVMEEALSQGGTSFDALYVDTQGNPGYFARSLNVYGREGQPCLRCGSTIARTSLGGRSHFHCPNCQN